jgi:hypothetical protein
MKLYSRAEEKDLLIAETERDMQATDIGDYYHYLYDYGGGCQGSCCKGITMENVRRGWLMNLLIKLKLRSPREILEELDW